MNRRGLQREIAELSLNMFSYLGHLLARVRDYAVESSPRYRKLNCRAERQLGAWKYTEKKLEELQTAGLELESYKRSLGLKEGEAQRLREEFEQCEKEKQTLAENNTIHILNNVGMKREVERLESLLEQKSVRLEKISVRLEEVEAGLTDYRKKFYNSGQYEHIPAVVTDSSGKIVIQNRAALRLFDKKRIRNFNLGARIQLDNDEPQMARIGCKAYLLCVHPLERGGYAVRIKSAPKCYSNPNHPYFTHLPVIPFQFESGVELS